MAGKDNSPFKVVTIDDITKRVTERNKVRHMLDEYPTHPLTLEYRRVEARVRRALDEHIRLLDELAKWESELAMSYDRIQREANDIEEEE